MADDQDLMLLTQYNYAESGNQDAEVWAANSQAMLNRLKAAQASPQKAKEYGGVTLSEIINKASSAIRTNSPQWQLATGQKERNEYEENVFRKILANQSALLKGNYSVDIGDATHFENIKAFGRPKWAKKMYKIKKVGEHTYYSYTKPPKGEQ